MKGIRFTVEGNDYSDDIKGGVETMFRQAVYKRLQHNLGGLISEIEAEGGTLTVDVDTGNIRFENCSAELISKIKNALK